MAAFAATTERVRLGQMCTCMGYRNPAYLAKVAATVDVISGGRVEMGIGGGWYEHEWRAYGYGFPRAGDRLGMLDEGVQIMRQVVDRRAPRRWTASTTRSTARSCRPLPLQDGGIPLWIAGGGEKKTLRIAAQYAQYTNFDATPETFRHKSEVLAQHCRDVGTRLRRDRALGQLQRRHRRDRGGRAGQARRGSARTTSRSSPEDDSSATATMYRERPARRHARADRRAAARGRAAGHDVRDQLLRRRRLRPEQHRAVRRRR